MNMCLFFVFFNLDSMVMFFEVPSSKSTVAGTVRPKFESKRQQQS